MCTHINDQFFPRTHAPSETYTISLKESITHIQFLFAPLPGFSTEGSSVIDGKLCEQAEIKLAKGLVDKRRVFNCPGLDTPQSLLDCGTRRGLLARNSRFGHPNDGYMMDLTDYSNVIGEVNIYHIWVCLEKPHKH